MRRPNVRRSSQFSLAILLDQGSLMLVEGERLKDPTFFFMRGFDHAQRASFMREVRKTA